MIRICKFFMWYLFIGNSLAIIAQDQESAFSIELTGSLSHFEQQIKTKIGGEKGDLLAANTELNIQAVGTYKVWKFITAGCYFQYDIGNRENSQISGFDASGAAQVMNVQGGAFREFWTGPILHAQYRQAFLEFGYGLVGTRKDDSRSDILNAAGSNQGNFSIDPSVAWIIGVGVQVNLSKKFDFLVKAQYRARYYNSRDGVEFENQAVYGTQNFSPLIGVLYRM